MKIKVIATTLSVIIGTALLCTGCVNEREDNSSNSELSSSSSSEPQTSGTNTMKTVEIFNLENASDMAVTLYFDFEEPTISFVMPDGKLLKVDDLPTDRKTGAVCFHIADAAPGQWLMNYDKKGNTALDVNWSPENYKDE